MSTEAEFQLYRIEALDRAGAITSVAAALASRGVNIDCFSATGSAGDPERKNGLFVVIIEADNDYGRVLANVLSCLEVVQKVDGPSPLNNTQLAAWRARFLRLGCEEPIS